MQSCSPPPPSPGPRARRPLAARARVLLLSLLAGAVTAGAMPLESPFAARVTTAEAPLPPQDLQFLGAAQRLHAGQEAAASLALELSRDVRVRQFARRLLRDHTAARRRLERIAAEKQVPLAAAAEQPLHAYGLAGLRGVAFDRQFVAAAGIGAHRAALRDFREQSRSGRDPELRRFAQATLPLLSRHFASAEALEAQFQLRRRNFPAAY